MTLYFRHANDADQALLLELDGSQTVEFVTQTLALQQAGKASFEVAYSPEAPGKILGQLVIHWADFPVVELSDLLVHPEYRGQGVGRQLLQTAEEKAWVGKFTQLKIVCNADPNCPERKLYTKLGYQPDSTQPERQLQTRFGQLTVVTLLKNV